MIEVPIVDSIKILNDFISTNRSHVEYTKNINESNLKKLEKLNHQQIDDLLQDVAEEVMKRDNKCHFRDVKEISIKREQAKEKISKLDIARLMELVENLTIDIKRRSHSNDNSNQISETNMIGGKIMAISTDCINSILNDLDIHCDSEYEIEKKAKTLEIDDLNSKLSLFQSQITSKDQELHESKEEINFLSIELRDSQLSNSIINAAFEECKTKIIGIDESMRLKEELNETNQKMTQLEYHLRQLPIRYSASQIGNFNAMFLLTKSRYQRINKENPLPPQVKIMIDSIKEILLASEQLANSLEILLDPIHPSLERVHTILPICSIIMKLISSCALGIINKDNNNLNLSNLLDNTSILVEGCESLLEEIVINE